MPSGFKIDWSLYDDIIRTELPNCTIEEFTQQFLPDISSKAVGARARKLDIQPAPYKCSTEHKAKIGSKLRGETPELVEQIRQLRDSVSINKLYKQLGITKVLLQRIIARHNIKLSEAGRARALLDCSTCSLGKIPWNKDGKLSDETKAKISTAVSGKKNSQFGKGMTEEEKERWRASYQANGIYKIREYFKTPEGKIALAKSITATRTPEFAAKMSNILADRMANGTFKPHSHHLNGYYCSSKLGKQVHYKSSWELAYYQFLDASDDVVFYEIEPFSISYYYDGCERNYLPDVLVAYVDGHVELVEIKPSKLLIQPKNAAKIVAGGEFAEANGIVFVVITEEELGEYIIV